MTKRKILSTGLAMFAMLFGAGNVVWPLVLGRDVGNQLWFGLFGFILIGVIVPLVGLISTMLCDGQYKKLLQRMGTVPAAITTLVCMIMIGPFMGIPRCITLSHASVKLYIPQFSLLLYSLFSAALIFACTVKKSRVIDILGNVLGPLKLTLLLAIIICGLFSPASFLVSGMTPLGAFTNGMSNGSLTGDLLGTIFFSGLIFSGIRSSMGDEIDYKKLASFGLQAGIIGATLLGLVYIGFCIVAAFNGAALAGVGRGEVFSILAGLALGKFGGLFANITIAVSTLTTAIALTTVFATYLHEEVLQQRVSYLSALITTTVLGIAISNIGFEMIAVFAGEVFFLIYPMLMMLAVLNVLNKLWGFPWIKVPVLTTFVITVFVRYGDALHKLLGA